MTVIFKNNSDPFLQIFMMHNNIQEHRKDLQQLQMTYKLAKKPSHACVIIYSE